MVQGRSSSITCLLPSFAPWWAILHAAARMILQYKSHDVTHPSSDSQIFDSLRLKAKLLTLGPHVLWDLNSHHFSDFYSHHPSYPALLTVSQGYQPPHYISHMHSSPGHLHLLFMLPDVLFFWYLHGGPLYLSGDLLSKIGPLSYTACTFCFIFLHKFHHCIYKYFATICVSFFGLSSAGMSHYEGKGFGEKSGNKDRPFMVPPQ